MSYLDKLLAQKLEVTRLEKEDRLKKALAEKKTRYDASLRTLDPNDAIAVDGDTFYDPNLGRRIRVSGNAYETYKQGPDGTLRNPYDPDDWDTPEEKAKAEERFKRHSKTFAEQYDKRDGFFRAGVTPKQLADAGMAQGQRLQNELNRRKEAGEPITYRITGLDKHGRPLAEVEGDFFDSLSSFENNADYFSQFEGLQRANDAATGKRSERLQGKEGRGLFRTAGDLGTLFGTGILGGVEELAKLGGQIRGFQLETVQDAANWLFDADLKFADAYKSTQDEAFGMSGKAIEWLRKKGTSEALKRSERAAEAERLLNKDLFTFNVNQGIKNGLTPAEAKFSAGMEEAGNTFRNLAQNPGRLLDMTFESLPYMMGVAGVGRMGIKVGHKLASNRIKREILDIAADTPDEILSMAVANHLASAAGKKSLQRWGSWSATGAIGVSEGASVGAAMYDRVMGMTEQEASQSERYLTLRKEGRSHEEALRDLAEDTFAQTFMWVGLLAGATGKITGVADWESRLLTRLADAKDVVRNASKEGIARSLAQRAVAYSVPATQEAVEEAIQSGGGELIGQAVTQSVTGIDQNVGEGIGQIAVEGAGAGAVSAGGVKGLSDVGKVIGKGVEALYKVEQTGDELTNVEPITEQVAPGARERAEKAVPADADLTKFSQDKIKDIKERGKVNLDDVQEILKAQEVAYEAGQPLPQEVVDEGTRIVRQFIDSAIADVNAAEAEGREANPDVVTFLGRYRDQQAIDTEKLSPKSAALYNMAGAVEEARAELQANVAEAREKKYKNVQLEKFGMEETEHGPGVALWAERALDALRVGNEKAARAAIEGLDYFWSTQLEKRDLIDKMIELGEAGNIEEANRLGKAWGESSPLRNPLYYSPKLVNLREGVNREMAIMAKAVEGLTETFNQLYGDGEVETSPTTVDNPVPPAQQEAETVPSSPSEQGESRVESPDDGQSPSVVADSGETQAPNPGSASVQGASSPAPVAESATPEGPRLTPRTPEEGPVSVSFDKEDTPLTMHRKKADRHEISRNGTSYTVGASFTKFGEEFFVVRKTESDGSGWSVIPASTLQAVEGGLVLPMPNQKTIKAAHTAAVDRLDEGNAKAFQSRLLKTFTDNGIEVQGAEAEGATTDSPQATPEADTEAGPVGGGPVNIWSGAGQNAVLSNLAQRPFTVQDRTYNSVEHAYQTWKTGEFDEKIYSDPRWQNPGVKITGAKRPRTEGNWNIHLMKRLIQRSFEQNPEAAAALLATGDAELTHNAPNGQRDIWTTQFPRILMEVRDSLREPDSVPEENAPSPVPTDDVPPPVDDESIPVDDDEAFEDPRDFAQNEDLGPPDLGDIPLPDEADIPVDENEGPPLPEYNQPVLLTQEETDYLRNATDAVLEEDGSVPSRTNEVLERQVYFDDHNLVHARKASKKSVVAERPQAIRDMLRKNGLPFQIRGALQVASRTARSVLAAIPNFGEAFADKGIRDLLAEHMNLKVEDRRSMEYMARFIGMFAEQLQETLVDLNDISKNGSPWRKEGEWMHERLQENPLLYFYDADGNLDKNLLTAMGAVSFNYLGSRATADGFNDKKAINRMLGRPENTKIQPWEQEMFGQGKASVLVAQGLGREVMTAMGLELRRQEGLDPLFIERLHASLGNAMIGAMLDMEMLQSRRVPVKAFEKAKKAGVGSSTEPSVAEGAAVGDDAMITFIHGTKDEEGRTIELLEQIGHHLGESGLVLDKLFGLKGFRRPPRFDKPTMRDIPRTYSRKRTQVPKLLRERLLKQAERPYRAYSRGMDLLISLGDSNVVERILGAPTQDKIENGTHDENLISQKSKREQATRSWRFMKKFYERYKDRETYFLHDVTSTSRMNLNSSTVQPQSDPFHRFIMRQDSWTETVATNPTTRRERYVQQQFLLAVGLGFDIDFSKMRTKTALQQVNAKYLEFVESGVLDAINAENRSDEQIEKIVSTVEQLHHDGAHGGHALMALEALAGYHQAIQNGDTGFETNLPTEVDGKTNGFSAGVLQTPGLLGYAKSLLEPTGVMFRDSLNDAGQLIRNFPMFREAGNKDNYEGVGQGTGKYLQDMKLGKVPMEKTLDPYPEKYEGREKLSAKEEARKLKFLRKLWRFRKEMRKPEAVLAAEKLGIFPTIEDLIGKAGRSFAKGPLTVSSYMGQPKNIKHAIIDDAFTKLYEQLEKVESWEELTAIRNRLMNLYNHTVEQARAAGIAKNTDSLEPMLTTDVFRDSLPKEMQDLSPSQAALKWAPTQRQMYWIREGLFNTYGYALEAALESKVGHMREIRDAVNALVNDMNLVFQARFRERVEQREGETGEPINNEDRRRILNAMIVAGEVPLVKSPLSESHLDALEITKDGTVYLRPENEEDNAKFRGRSSFQESKVRAEKQFTVDGKETDVDAIESLSNSLKAYEPNEDIGVAAIVKAIHSTDGAVMSRLVAEFDILGVHDAAVGNFTQMDEIARAGNGEYIRVQGEYSLVNEIVDAAIRMQNSLPGYADDINETLAPMLRLARENDEIRKQLFEQISHSNQFAKEGGEKLINAEGPAEQVTVEGFVFGDTRSLPEISEDAPTSVDPEAAERANTVKDMNTSNVEGGSPAKVLINLLKESSQTSKSVLGVLGKFLKENLSAEEWAKVEPVLRTLYQSDVDTKIHLTAADYIGFETASGKLAIPVRPSDTFFGDFLESLAKAQGVEVEIPASVNMLNRSSGEALGSSNQSRAGRWVKQQEGTLTADNLKAVLDHLAQLEGPNALSADGRARIDRLVESFLYPMLQEVDGVVMRFGTNPNGTMNIGWELGGTVYVEAAGNAASNNAQMSLQEVTVHELVHAVTRRVLNESPELRSKAQTLFEIADKNLTWKDFLEDQNNYSVAEEEQARARHAYIFRNDDQQLGLDEDGKVQAPRYLHEFLAIAVTNPAMSRALENIEFTQEDTIAEPESLLDRIINLVSRIFGFANEKFRGISREKNLSTEMRGLLQDITAQKHQSMLRVKQLIERTTEWGNVSDKFIINVAERFSKRMEKLTRDIPVPELGSGSRAQRTANALKKIGIDGAQNNIESIKKVLEEYFENSRKDNFFFEMVSEVLPYPEKNRSWIALLRKVGAAIDMARQQAAEHTRASLLQAFADNGKKLKPKQREALTYAILKTDLGALFNSADQNYGQLIELLRDSSARKQLKEKLEQDLRNLMPEGDSGKVLFNLLVAQSDGLANLMINGTVSEDNQMQNAHNIARQFFLRNPNDRIDAGGLENEIQEVIDPYVSLLAINKQHAADTVQIQRALEVIDAEMARDVPENGFTRLLGSSIAFERASRAKSFDNNPTQMVKGYMYEIFDENVDIRFARGSKEDDAMMAAEGYQRLQNLPSDRLDPSPIPDSGIVMYVSHRGIAQYNQSIMTLNNPRKRGVGLMESTNRVGAFNKFALNAVRQARRDMAVEGSRSLLTRARGGEAETPRGIMLPLVNDEGEIVDYRYVMSEKTKKNVLKKRDTFDEVLPRMFASLIDRNEAPRINREVIDLMKKEWLTYGKPDEKGNQTTKQKFLVISPDSEDPKAKEMWHLLPDSTKAYAEEVFGSKKLVLRSEAVNLVMGFRKLSFAQGKSGEFFGRAAPIVKRAETVWQEAMKLLRHRIAITTPRVVLGNIASNTAVLLAEGIPPDYITKHSHVAMVNLRKYMKEAKRVDMLKTEIGSEEARGLDVTKKRAEMARLEANLRINPVAELIQEGLFTSIVEDLGYDQQRTSTQFLNKALDRIDSEVPTAVTTVVKEAYMMPGSETANVALVATQFGDFTARYVQMKWNIEKGMSRPDAIDRALATFIFYNMPQNRWLQAANDNGFMMFTKFFARIQPVALRIFRENPARAVTLLSAQQVLEDLNPVFGENVANYAFLQGATRKFEPTPWDNFTGENGTNILHPALLSWLNIFGIGK